MTRKRNKIISWVRLNELIEYTLEDDRKVIITFAYADGQTAITEIFEAETTYPVEFQKVGWQSILNNFKKYVELTH